MVSNVHRRFVPAPVEVVGPLLERVADPAGGIWPTDRWWPLILDRGLVVGSRGGHGSIRYRVSGYEPGRWVRFAFHPRLGVDGYHEFTVREVPGGSDVTHTVSGRLHGRMRWLWPLAVRWLHDAVLEDLLDNAERAATGTVAVPRGWPLRVRILRRLVGAPGPGAGTPAATTTPGAGTPDEAQRTASSQSRA